MSNSGAMGSHDQGPNRVSIYAQFANNEQLPPLQTFIEQHPDLSLEELGEIVRWDQRMRWERGDRPSTESYLAQFPNLANDLEAVTDLAYSEYLLRTRYDNDLDAQQFVARFPNIAKTLHAQIQFHLACEPIAPSASRDTDIAPQPDSTFWQQGPQTIGRYVIERQLGRGGMGRVYLARDTLLDRRVALKRPRIELGNERLLQRFYREARLAARLAHPHVCAVYDFGEIDGIHYLTMAYIEGESLADYLARHGRLSIERSVQWVRQVALAMAESHRLGVLHRDLKPANIMIDAQQGPIVTDFGLARCDDLDVPRYTTQPTLFGTIAYSAPEQFDGLAAGASADIYSLGVILYELLTGRQPFSGPVTKIIRDVITQAPIPPRELNPAIPPSLETVCLRAMHKDPLGRWESMIAFAEALDSCLPKTTTSPNRVVTEQTESSADITRPTYGRRFYLLGVPIVALLALIVGLLGPKWKTLLRRAPTAVDAEAKSASGAHDLAVPTGELAATSGEDPTHSFRDEDGSSVDLWHQVRSNNLADGAFTDVSVNDNLLTFDASGRSKQLWLNFPEAHGAPLRLRTGIHIDRAQGDGFVKMVYHSSDGELSAMLWPSRGELHAGIFNSSSERVPESNVVVAKLSESIDVDIEFYVGRDHQVLSMTGHPRVEQRLSLHPEGTIALVVAGWKVDFRRPRAVMIQTSSPTTD